MQLTALCHKYDINPSFIAEWTDYDPAALNQLPPAEIPNQVLALLASETHAPKSQLFLDLLELEQTDHATISVQNDDELLASFKQKANYIHLTVDYARQKEDFLKHFTTEGERTYLEYTFRASAGLWMSFFNLFKGKSAEEKIEQYADSYHIKVIDENGVIIYRWEETI